MDQCEDKEDHEGLPLITPNMHGLLVPFFVNFYVSRCCCWYPLTGFASMKGVHHSFHHMLV
ncbi:hypothetical protein JHK82_054989 [Glycine max]|nr:hypothetical protein JHK82_054989 [Glycine max]